jgi:NSS family neurotransmitter:Na+ symporter
VKATLATGGGILILGIPSALSGGPGLFGDRFKQISEWWGGGQAWFDVMFNISYNLMLPLGGLGIATFVAWRVGDAVREQGFKTGTRLGRLYWGWVQLLRYIVPIGVILVLLNAIGVFD